MLVITFLVRRSYALPGPQRYAVETEPFGTYSCIPSHRDAPDLSEPLQQKTHPALSKTGSAGPGFPGPSLNFRAIRPDALA